MAESKADWDFGQALIELGLVTLDQVREALAIQDRMREMGVVPKTLREILVEKGYVASEKVAAAERKAGTARDLPEIPGYRLHQRIGSGGMGAVWRATQISLNRTVAIKILAPRLAKDPAYVDRFLKEARAVARLQHPNLVSGIDAGEAKGVYYLVMEYVEGRTLWRILEGLGRFEEPEALRIALQVAQGLDHAHRHKIVHGDVKPGNVMVMPDGLARLCDLGLAREIARRDAGPALGTKHYMSPEQARGEPLDGRSDVYSLGMTLGHILTGSHPAPVARIPGPAGDLVRRMTDPDPAKRPPSALAVVREIEAILAAPAAKAPTKTGPAASRRAYRAPSRSPFAAPLLLIVACLAAAAVWYWVRHRRVEPPAAAPETPAPRPAGSEADRQAEEELRQIGLAQDLDGDFDRAAEVLGRYRAFVAKHRGRIWEGRAARDESAYRKRLEESARGYLSDIRRKEERPRGEGKFGTVLALYRSFPGKFLDVTEAGAIVRTEIGLLEAKILDLFTADKAAIEGALRDGKAEDAATRLAFMDGYLGGEYRREYADLKARVEKARSDRAERVRAEVTRRYDALDGPFREAMKARDFRAAAAVVLRFLEGPWTAEEAAHARREGLDVAVLKGLVDGWQCGEIARLCECDPEGPDSVTPAEAALLDLRAAAFLDALFTDAETGLAHAAEAGDRERYSMAGIQGKKGYYVRQDGRVWFLVENDRRYPMEMRRLPAEQDVVQLAARGLDADRAKSEKAFESSARHQLAAALLFHFAGNPIQARVRFGNAFALGAKGARIYLASLGAAEETRLRAHLTKTWQRARERFGERKLGEAREDVLELLKHADHPLVKSWRAEIDKLLSAIDADLGAAERLASDLRGKVTLLDRGEVRVAYDFSDRRQLDAFEVLQLRKNSVWKLQDGGIESSGQAAALRWKAKVTDDVVVEYGLRPIDDPQNLVMDLYFNPDQKRHYAVTFGFDWVGRAQGDRENTVEDNFGMPRTCVIKYPVSADISQWERAAQWEIWKSRLVGRRGVDARPQKGRRHLVRIERRGKAIRLFLDGAGAWEGEDAEYTSGYLVLFADSRARIDDLAITFTPGK
ncbi:MAG: serine/threonine protein kinase [Planctomycetes bacterium]|nr:serine/threonine protein kinase [Planctomycetota bacterium]